MRLLQGFIVEHLPFDNKRCNLRKIYLTLFFFIFIHLNYSSRFGQFTAKMTIIKKMIVSSPPLTLQNMS